MDYPKINVKEIAKLVSIIEQASSDESYFDPASCPYDEGTINLLKRLLEVAEKAVCTTTAPQRGKVGRPSKQPIIPMDEVEKEIDEIRQELTNLKVEGQTMETKDRIQVIKTRAALIERVLGMKTEIGGLKQYNSFIKTVIGIMEEHLDGPEREKVLLELKNYVEQ
jgi:hypothetical protein